MEAQPRTGPVAALLTIAAIMDDKMLGAAEKVVLARIVCHADNGTGLAWASYGGLQKKCGVSRMTVMRAVQKGLGRHIERAEIGVNRTIRYRILTPQVVHSVDHGGILSILPVVTPEDRGGILSVPILTPKTNSTNLTPKTTPPERAPRRGPSVSKRKAKAMYKPSAETLEMIYQAYPKHVGKAAALKAIAKTARIIEQRRRAANELPSQASWDAAATWLLTRTREYAASPKGQKPAKGQPDYRPHPATWFNQGRYDDDRSEWNAGPTADRSPSRPDLRDDSRYTEFLTGE